MEEFRVKFEIGQQKKFIQFVKKKLNCTLMELSKKDINVSVSSLRHYSTEYCLMPLSLVTSLCYLSGINIRKLNVSYLPENWGDVKGGKAAMHILKTKYSDKLDIWRRKAKKASVNSHLKNIKIPEMNEDLAEFIGVYLGDGTITPYFINITGDSRYDLRYFEYLRDLVKRLFNLESKISKDKKGNILYLTIWSKLLCKLLHEEYNIKFGDKIRNQTCIPQEIMNDKKLSLACLRGLVDTDGCISRRGRGGSQFCVQFFNQNKKLLEQVRIIGSKYGFFSYSTGNEVGTNSWNNILRYFNEVGSSNLKHIVRFNVRKTEGRTLYLREVLDYYEKPFYKEVLLPFKEVEDNKV